MSGISHDLTFCKKNLLKCSRSWCNWLQWYYLKHAKCVSKRLCNINFLFSLYIYRQSNDGNRDTAIYVLRRNRVPFPCGTLRCISSCGQPNYPNFMEMCPKIDRVGFSGKYYCLISPYITTNWHRGFCILFHGISWREYYNAQWIHHF